MIHNVLVRQLPLPADRVSAALAAAGIAADRRPQTLSVDDWLALRAALGPVAADRRGRRAGQDRDGVPDAAEPPDEAGGADSTEERP
jgi:hypothetical protein